MKKFLLFLFSLLSGIILFVWVLETVGWQEIKSAFLVFTGWEGMAILVLTVLVALIGTWKWKEILKGGGVDISFKSLLNPYLAGFAVMFLAPILVWGGEMLRSYILKERNSVPWSKGMASVIIDRILEWTANLVVVFLGSIFFVLMVDLPPMRMVVIFGGAFLLFTVLITYFYIKSIRKESLIGFLFKQSKPLDVEKEIFSFFKPKGKAMWRAVGLSFLRATVMYARAWLLILFLGKTIGALPALSVLGFTYLAVLLPIPAALGSHEAIQTFAFNSLGLGASTATAFTMIIRGAELVIALLGVIIMFRLGVILLKNTFFRKLDNVTKDNVA